MLFNVLCCISDSDFLVNALLRRSTYAFMLSTCNGPLIHACLFCLHKSLMTISNVTNSNLICTVFPPPRNTIYQHWINILYVITVIHRFVLLFGDFLQQSSLSMSHRSNRVCVLLLDDILFSSNMVCPITWIAKT